MRPVAFLSLCALVLVGCARGGSGASDGQLTVVASVYPVEFLLERIGGDAIDVQGLTPSGAEPHDLELSSDQVIDLVEADLVAYVGRGFQPAVEDALQDVDDDRKLDILAGAELLESEEDEEHKAEHGEGEIDPHVWLDPSRMGELATTLAARLTDLDPSDASKYEDNAGALVDELADLDRALESGLADCESREFVTSHAAFGYLAERYDLEQVSVSGIDPEAEPSPQRLAEVARFVEEHDVRVIFFEELAPPDLAQTLASETGATTDVLATLETAPEDGDYIDAMLANLERLRGALRCA